MSSSDRHSDAIQVDAVLAVDGGGRVVFLSPEAETLFGYSREEILGQSMNLLIPARLHPEHNAEFQLYAAGTDTARGMAASHVLSAVRKGGQEIPIKASLLRVELGGEPLSLVLVRDAAAELDAAAALAESELRYRLLYEQSLDAIYMTSPDGRILHCNRAALELFKIDPAEVGSLRTLDFYVDPSERERLKAAAESGALENVEIRSRARDGTEFVALHSTAPIRDRSGAIIGYQGIVRDITQRKAAEDALRESEERFRIAFDNAPDGMSMMALDGHFIHPNRTMREMLGYSEEELRTLTFTEVTHPEDRALGLEETRQCLEGALSSFELTKRYLHKDGHVVCGHLSAAIVRDSAGKPVHFIAQIHDITERRRAEMALKRSEERYRRLVEASPEGILEHCDGIIVFVNEASCRMLRARSREALLGQPVMSLVAASDYPLAMDRIAKILDGETVPFAEQQLIRLDGTLVFCEVTGIRTEHEGRPAVQLLIRDLSERQQARQALASREAHFRALIEHGLDIITVLDEEGTILFNSPSLGRVLGYRPDEVVGRPLSELVHTDDRPLVESALAQALAAPGKVLSVEIRLRHADGTWRWVEARGRNLLDDGPVGGIIVNARDVTERVEAAEALRGSEERLRLAEKLEAVGKLAGGIAHDFNNLLTVIMGNAQMLLEDTSSDGRQSEIEQILHSAAHAASLTRQLLAFGRKQILRPTVVDLNAVLEGLSPMLRRLAREDILLNISLAPDLPNVKVDAGQLEQVVLNLAINALDAMPEGGELTIETGTVDVTEASPQAELPVGQYVVLAVGDTGHGIPPEHLPRIFEPFFTTKEVGRGAGLGLASVYGIVKQSGGEVLVESSPAGGSVFQVVIPAAFEPVTPTEMGDAHGQSTAPDERLLLVEDEPAVRQLARRVLERQGYRVLEAGSGDEALALLDENPGPLRLVITDVVMPGMDGRELVEKLRTRWPDLNVLFVSGYTEDEVLRRGVSSRGEHFLPKPFTPRELLDRARLLLEQAGA